jgi:hypothetical protein
LTEQGLISGTARKLKQGTMTLGFDPLKSFEPRIEVRQNRSNYAELVRSITAGTLSEFAATLQRCAKCCLFECATALELEAQAAQ